MKIYLVGGAIRDKLLNYPVKERDWVVVGSTPEQLLELGYQTVGKDFPVFLHPETKEEYALARTERKVSPGYTGFEFNASPSVTLEEDLLRRDLTINAIAESKTGELIDPYNGQQDLKEKTLRHVSPAFSEDPVRLLRVARFAARFPEFEVADETIQLMQTMVNNGEVNALVAERVWQELEKALKTKAPWRFFEVLIECNALTVIFPQLIFNSNARQALVNAAQLTEEKSARLAALLSQTEAVKTLCKRLRIPKNYSDLAQLTQRCLNLLPCSSPEALLQLFELADAFRRSERFLLLIETLVACDSTLATEKKHWLTALEHCQSISAAEVDPELKGFEIAKAIRALRLKQLCSLVK